MNQAAESRFMRFGREYPGLLIIINWVWFWGMIFIALFDKNLNFLFGLILWFVLNVWLYGKGPKPQWLKDHAWVGRIWDFFRETPAGTRFVVWKHWMFLMFFLCLTGYGPLGNPKTTISLVSPWNVRYVPANHLTFHIPVLENMDVWPSKRVIHDPDIEVSTLDAEKLQIELRVELVMIGPLETSGLVEKYGNYSDYRDASYAAVKSEMQRVSSQFTKEELLSDPAKLLDHGFNKGLEAVGLFWSDIKINKISIDTSDL